MTHDEWRIEKIKEAITRGRCFVMFEKGYEPRPNPALIAEIGADFRNALGWAGNGHPWTFSVEKDETNYWPDDPWSSSS